ncbi:MAG: co-chaperone GroES [Minisyncoccia bacterium]
MKLLDNYVLLEGKESGLTETKSGIFVPTAANVEETPNAKVVAVAEAVCRVKVGDVVLYNHLFDEIMVDGKRYLKGKEDGIYAILSST